VSALRVGIIGGGGMGRAHLAAYSRNEDTRPLWVADQMADRATAVAAEYALDNSGEDYHQLLEEAPVDVVSICLPTGVHAEAVEAAAAAGAHVMLEKPIALTLADADRVIAAVERAGVKLMLAYFRRFDAGWLAMRDLVMNGDLGRPVVQHSSRMRGVPTGRPWVLDPVLGGGYLLEAGNHHLDFARWMWGDPVSVEAVVDRMAPDTRVPDTLHAVLAFAGGARLVLNWCFGGPAEADVYHQVEWVIGPDGMLQLHPVFGPVQYYPREGKPMELAGDAPDPYALEINHFVQCVLDGRPPDVTGEDGRKALEMHLAILRAGGEAAPE